jgi:hypothetical protein
MTTHHVPKVVDLPLTKEPQPELVGSNRRVEFDLAVRTENVPLVLRATRRWLNWSVEHRDGKTTKVPRCPSTPLRKASVVEPATWGSFERAIENAREGDLGIGFVLSDDDDIIGVDFDNCLDPETGESTRPAIVEAAQTLNSYTEKSPSRSGLRVFLRATGLDYGNGRRGRNSREHGIEIYSASRFLTVTGDHFAGSPKSVELRQDEAERLLVKFFSPTPKSAVRVARAPVHVDDDQIIERAGRAANGEKFLQLFQGDFSEYPSKSEADLALCSIIAFWTQDDDQIDRIFRRSGLARDKWDRDDYRQATISTALGSLRNTYSRSSGPRQNARLVSHPSQSTPQRDHDEASEAGEAAPLAYRTGITIEEANSKQIEFLLGELVARGVTTLVSAGGGTGKTCLLMQLALESALGHAPWGLDKFKPNRPLRILYVNGEDEESTTDYWLVRLMTGLGIDVTPDGFAHLTLSGSGVQMMDTCGTARILATARQHGADIVIIDTAISVVSDELSNYIDPKQTRRFLNTSCGALQRAGLGVIMAVHDAKDGKIAAGSAAWTNFARLAFQVEIQEKHEDHAILKIDGEHKANFGWPYGSILLKRPHETLICEPYEILSIEQKKARIKRDAESEDQALRKAYRVMTLSLTQDMRSRSRVVDHLMKSSGLPRKVVRTWADKWITWESGTGQRAKAQMAIELLEKPSQERSP